MIPLQTRGDSNNFLRVRSSPKFLGLQLIYVPGQYPRRVSKACKEILDEQAAKLPGLYEGRSAGGIGPTGTPFESTSSASKTPPFGGLRCLRSSGSGSY